MAGNQLRTGRPTQLDYDADQRRVSTRIAALERAVKAGTISATAATVSGNTVNTTTTANRGLKGDRGLPGAAATIAIGTVSTGAPGSDATVANLGTTNAAVLDFAIPAGDPAVSRLIVQLCGAYTPAATGGDFNTLFVLPFDTEGASLSFVVQGIFLRKESAGATAADLDIALEQYTGTGAFAVDHSQTFTLPSGDFEIGIAAADVTAFTFTSGDKLRANFVSYGTASGITVHLILSRAT